MTAENIRIDNENQNETIEAIEKAKIDTNLDKLDLQNTLETLAVIDSAIPNYDIDLTYNPNEDKYYFLNPIKWWWDNIFNKLEIGLNKNDIASIWEILVELFKAEDTQLTRSRANWLSILTEKEYVPIIFESNIVSSWDLNLSEQDINKLYTFVKSTQSKFEIVDWKLKSKKED
mgnify:FL=1